MTLDMVNRGDMFEIISIRNENIRAQAIRLCIYEGSILKCTEKIPAGPIVLKNKLQEVALSRKLAEQIVINRIS